MLIFYVSIKPSPSRIKLLPKDEEANKLIKYTMVDISRDPRWESGDFDIMIGANLKMKNQ